MTTDQVGADTNAGKVPMGALEISYVVRSSAQMDKIMRRATGRLDAISPLASEYSVVLHGRNFSIAVDKPLSLNFVYDGSARLGWFVDKELRTYSGPQRLSLGAFVPSPQRTLRFRTSARRRAVPIGNERYHVHEELLDVRDIRCSAWVVDGHQAHAGACRSFWHWLLPWLDAATMPQTMPLEFMLMGGAEILQPLLHLQATRVSPIAAPPPFRPSKEYSLAPMSLGIAQRVLSDNERLRSPSAAATTRPTARHLRSHRSRVRGLAGTASLQVGAATQQGDLSDFAWVFGDTFLGRAREVINRLAASQGGYNIRNNTMFIDWWNSGLLWSINPDQDQPEDPDDPNPGTRILLRAMRSFALLAWILAKRDPPNFSPDGIFDYQRLLQQIGAGSSSNTGYRTVNQGGGTRSIDFDANMHAVREAVRAHLGKFGFDQEEDVDTVFRIVCPYLLMCESSLADAIWDELQPDEPQTSLPSLTTLYSAAATASLEAAVFASLTAARFVGVPFSGEQSVGGWARVGITDIEGRIDLHDPLIESATFAENRLMFHARLDSASASFLWYSYPTIDLDDPEDVVKKLGLAVLTGGLSLAILFNAGAGDVTLPDLRPVFAIDASHDSTAGTTTFDLTLLGNTMSGGTVSLDATMDADVFGTIGVLIKAYLSSALTQAGLLISDELGDKEWPSDFWHASGGPSVRSTCREVKVWSGAIAIPIEITGRPLASATIDHALADPMACILTERYLTGWVREKIKRTLNGEMAAHIDLGLGKAEWESKLPGLVLPDPAELLGSGPMQAVDPYSEFSTAVQPADRIQGAGLDRANYLRGIAEALMSGNPLPPVNCTPPATKPTQYFYRTMATRALPVVRFQKEGEVSNAGRLTIEYAIALEAVQISYTNHMIGMTKTECREIPAHAGMGVGTIAAEDFPINPASRFSSSHSPQEQHADPLGPLGDSERGTVMYCENPECVWNEFSEERVIKRLVRARILVNADLVLGFVPEGTGSVWLPEIQIRVDDSSVGTLLAKNSLEIESAFRGFFQTSVEQVLNEAVLANASVLLEGLNESLVLKRRLLPLSEDYENVFSDGFWEGEGIFPIIHNRSVDKQIRKMFLDVVRFQQVESQDVPHYTIKNGVLYWRLEMTDRIDEIVEHAS